MSFINFLKTLFLPEVDAHTVSKEEEKEREVFPELNEAKELFQSEKYDRTRAIAENFTNSKNPDLQFEAENLIALTYFRQGLYAKSEEIFERLSKTSIDSDDWFNFTISLTLNSKFKESEIAFSKALKYYKEYGSHEQMSIPNLRFFYMQSLKDMKQYDLAFKQLSALSKIYINYTITDSTFLYMRGVPFFQHTVDSSKEILESVSTGKAKRWMNSMKNGVDKYGKDYLTEFEKTLNL